MFARLMPHWYVSARLVPLFFNCGAINFSHGFCTLLPRCLTSLRAYARGYEDEEWAKWFDQESPWLELPCLLYKKSWGKSSSPKREASSSRNFLSEGFVNSGELVKLYFEHETYTKYRRVWPKNGKWYSLIDRWNLYAFEHWADPDPNELTPLFWHSHICRNLLSTKWLLDYLISNWWTQNTYHATSQTSIGTLGIICWRSIPSPRSEILGH